jgi:signal transduction histidine kinase
VISLKSIFSRIIFLHVIAMIIVAIFMPLVLFWFVKSSANDLHARAMREHADALARHLVLHPDGTWTLDLPPVLQALYSPAYGRYAYAVLDGTGKALFSSLEKSSPIFPQDFHSSLRSSSRPGEVEFMATGADSSAMSGVSLAKEMAGRTVWVQVGEDFAHRDVIIDDIVADFFRRVGWITLPMLLFLLAIDIVIFRRALLPLLQASEMARKISPNRMDVRLSSENIPMEILPLVQAVNQALDRLEVGFRVQREFTGDAAHELRTPLAILRGRVDTLADRGVSKALHQDIDGMTRIVGQLLDIAELETYSIDPQETADLRAICAEIAEFAAPLALSQGKSIALSGTEASLSVNGNPEMLSRAIRNLVENAINYSPPGATVEIVVDDGGPAHVPEKREPVFPEGHAPNNQSRAYPGSFEPGYALVHVLDEGPGIADDERELIFQRFWRRDRRRAGSAGLGLSIVQRIAEAHAATVSVENRPMGGANFSLRFARGARSGA